MVPLIAILEQVAIAKAFCEYTVFFFHSHFSNVGLIFFVIFNIF